jgi:hypothetical protein
MPPEASSSGTGPQRLRERRRFPVCVHEEQRAPRLDRELAQSDPVGVEPGLIARTRGRTQVAIQPVRPGVVAALQRLPVASTLDDDRAAADVEQRVQLTGPVPCHHHRNVAGAAREEVARFGGVLGRAGVLPTAPEDQLLLAPQQLGIGVPAPRQRPLRGPGSQTGHDSTGRIGARRRASSTTRRTAPTVSVGRRSTENPQVASSSRWPRLLGGRVAFSEARRLRSHPGGEEEVPPGYLSCSHYGAFLMRAGLIDESIGNRRPRRVLGESPLQAALLWLPWTYHRRLGQGPLLFSPRRVSPTRAPS